MSEKKKHTKVFLYSHRRRFSTILSAFLILLTTTNVTAGPSLPAENSDSTSMGLNQQCENGFLDVWMRLEGRRLSELNKFFSAHPRLVAQCLGMSESRQDDDGRLESFDLDGIIMCADNTASLKIERDRP